MPPSDLRGKIVELDKLAAQAIAILSDQVAAGATATADLVRRFDGLRDEIHALAIKVSDLGNAELKDDVKDHEKRLRIVEEYKARLMGMAASVAFVVSGATWLLSKLIH